PRRPRPPRSRSARLASSPRGPPPPPPRRPRPLSPRPRPPRSRRFYSIGALGGSAPEGGEGSMTGGRVGISSTRGLKFGSTSTTPIFGSSGGAARCPPPREPRRNRAPRAGTPPPTGGCTGRIDGGADDAGIGGSFASSRSGAPTASGAGAPAPTPTLPPARTSAATSPSARLWPSLSTAGTLLALVRWGAEYAGGLRRSAGDTRAERDLVLPVVQLVEVDESFVGRLYHELREAREPCVLLVERGVDLLHNLLQAVGAHDVIVRRHLLHRFDDQLPGIAAHIRDVALLGESGELVVRVVLVAILNQQIARRLADPNADHVLAVLLELQHQGREVRVPGQEDEGPDLGAREDELQRV